MGSDRRLALQSDQGRPLWKSDIFVKTWLVIKELAISLPGGGGIWKSASSKGNGQ